MAGALQDPRLDLLDSTGAVIETNDNWQDSPEVGEIIASTLPPTDPREAAIVARLDPGNYTVDRRGRERHHRHRPGGKLHARYVQRLPRGQHLHARPGRCRRG